MADRLHRSPRTAAGALAGALLLLPLAACSFTSNNVNCSGNSCTATLQGEDAKATILGNDLVFAGTEDGRASISVGDNSVSCTEGESVQAGPLSITCTSITDDGLELTAELG